MKPQRLNYLDWLRVLIILNLIPFHVAWLMTFVKGFSNIPQDSFLTNTVRSYVAFVSYWQMPLLFFISGAGTFIALEFRSASRYCMERIQRLLVPLVFFMVFLYPLFSFFWPPNNIDKNVAAYFSHWRELLPMLLYQTRTYGPAWAHLWFVGYLLIFSFLMLPVFLKLKRLHERNTDSQRKGLFTKPWMVFLPGTLFVFVLAALETRWPLFRVNLYTDWTWFTCNLTTFILGFLLCMDKSFWVAVKGYWKYALLFAFFASALTVNERLNIYHKGISLESIHLQYTILSGLGTWCWIIGLLGFSMKNLANSNALLRYFNRASYPFYIIHEIVILIIGYFIAQWRIGVIPEYILLCVFSFVISMMIYEQVKRTKVTRILFGMKG